MLKEAIEKLIDLTNGSVLSAHGKAYSRHELRQLPSPRPTAKPLEFHSLTGMIDYLQEGMDGTRAPGYALVVESPTKVDLVSKVEGEFRQREVLASSLAVVADGFRCGQYHDIETFVTALQACFVPDEQTALVLQVVGNIAQEGVQTLADDGVSQVVTARAGLTRVANLKVPNPVTLRPFRTFQEIAQPASKFVLRLQGKGSELPKAGLFEVADNQWRREAIVGVGDYLAQQLDALDVKIPVFA